jgi:uncharacterized protein YaiE (UPF0345 family)
MITTNDYFDGNVKSLGFESNGRKTLGVMEPGEYTFDTSMHETMQVVAGMLTVRLPGSSEWKDYGPGETFEVPAGAEFDLKVAVATGYLCSYA